MNRRTGNSLLDALPQQEFERIQLYLKPIPLAVAQVLSKQGEPVDNVYFPKTGLVSCRATGSAGETIVSGVSAEANLGTSVHDEACCRHT